MAATLPLTPPLLRSFLRNIEKPFGDAGCWLWRGPVNGNGYGVCSRGVMAYRVAYAWMVGPIAAPDLDHLCRNRLCVNPHHLEPVTRSENVRRQREHGPFLLRRYCRRGHAVSRKSAWIQASTGTLFCRECRRFRREQRHAA